ncbi:MAG: DUF1499 domain-containing protein [Desulfofustis sp.]|nr:DUF1499 domain-containing protein [Desulfofustis sp.]
MALLIVCGAMTAACGSEHSPDLARQGDRLAACPASPNCVSSRATDNRHHIDPLAGGDDPVAVFAQLERLLSARVDTLITEKQPGYLRVVFHTTFFKDDGEFLLDEKRGVIDMRSASRVGYWDFGKNRRRLEEIRAALQERSAGR